MDFKQLLKRANLTIPQAAELLGVTRQTVYRYARHGAPIMAHRALEFRAGTNPDYYGLRFLHDGVWCESRMVIERKTLVEFEWLLQREFMRGEASAMKHVREA